MSDLDPLLQTLWLSGVVEAKSMPEQLADEPAAFGGLYAVGFFAICICIFRILHADRRRAHAVALVLIGVSYAIALIQVRGAIFANLLAIPPLALLIGELRRKAREEPDQLGTGLVFALATFLSVPSAWALFGVLFVEGTAGVTNRMRVLTGGPASTTSEGAPVCESAAGYQTLASLPAGTVAGRVRFRSGNPAIHASPDPVGPYHRNQGGMLTELHIGLARPEEAIAFLRGAKVDYLAFCPTFAQTRTIAATKADGLYASLLAGNVPDYLHPVPIAGPSGLQIYRVELP